MATILVRDGNGDPVTLDIPANVATQAKQDVAAAILSDILAKIASGGSTAAKQDTIIANLGTIITALGTLDGRVDGLETLIGSTNTLLTTISGNVDGLEALIGTVNTNLGLILAKLSADPATGAKQDASKVTLDAILAKLLAAPASEAKQDALITLLGGGTAPTSVAATFTAVGSSSAFLPLSRRPFNVAIWGTFVATLVVEVSVDGGTVWMPVTAAGVSYSETSIAGISSFEEGAASARYRLTCTSYTSGTVNYRIA